MGKINKKELHEIFEELRNGKQTSYDMLYRKYYSLVYGITFAILKNKEDCEDVTQEIFTKIYNLDIEKLPVDNEASWLFIVSKNECFMYLRKRKSNIDIEEIYEIPSQSKELEEIVDIDYYNNLIGKLKEEEKLIVSLKVLANFTFKKISQIMNIPIGTVQWKYYKSVNTLKISIGSLIGAIITFLVFLSKGEFWNKREYLNESYKDEKTNEIKDNKEENIKDIDNIESSSLENYENVGKDTVTNNDNEDDRTLNESNSMTEEGNYQTFCITTKNEKSESINDWKNTSKVMFVTTIITFLIIFVIFFKKYQQKMRKKSSK